MITRAVLDFRGSANIIYNPIIIAYVNVGWQHFVSFISQSARGAKRSVKEKILANSDLKNRTTYHYLSAAEIERKSNRYANIYWGVRLSLCLIIPLLLGCILARLLS